MNKNEIQKNDNNREFYLSPVTDILETGEEYTLRMEMPGVTRDNLEVTVHDDELEIRGTVTNDVPAEKKLKYAEYSLHNYRRVFRIGEDINRDALKATLENGVLTLTMAKAEKVKPRRIEITAH